MSKKKFREFICEKSSFVVTWEMVPGRGAREQNLEKLLKEVEKAAKGNIVHAVSITDNPGGNIGIRPDAIGREVAAMGLEPIIHLTCKDKNRYQLESELYALERQNLTNILALTGDYSMGDNAGRPKPVFDIDSTHLLSLIRELNQGMNVFGVKSVTKLTPCSFFPGAAVSPFKATEAEVMMQYSKLSKKIANGAQFIITQIGYDIRKYHELLLYTQSMGWDVPLIGNLYLLTFPAARAMNQNKIPGCVVTDKLLSQLEREKESPDKGKQASLERAAKLYAVLKGIGYKGVHIGGHNVVYEQVEYIVTRGEEMSANWPDYVHEFDYPQEQGFYLFEKDQKTGLNTRKFASRSSRFQVDHPGTYKLSRGFHKLFFIPGKNLFGLMQKLCFSIKDKKISGPFHRFEHMAKSAFYHCQDCGDCALLDTAYVCPMGDCPKNQRNGPCEGSYNGWCEVYPGEKRCIWVRAYERAKRYGEEQELNSYQVSPYNWKLRNTSSWINFYLGRDHSAARLSISENKQESGKK